MKMLHRLGSLCALSLAAVGATGCSGGAPSESENVAVQGDELRGRRICAGPRDRECPADQYCKAARPGRCPSAHRVGVCASRPEACTKEYQPVCGCDGVTYGNACTAAAAGVAVASKGACEPDGSFCGGIAGFPCPDGQACIDDPSDDCDPANGGADCGGICVNEPDPCALVRCPAGTECVADGDQASCVPIGTCGDTVCAGGLVCCNPLLGICTPPGGVCIF